MIEANVNVAIVSARDDSKRIPPKKTFASSEICDRPLPAARQMLYDRVAALAAESEQHDAG